MKNLLAAVTAAVEAEGRELEEEFHLPQGPRGSRGNAPVDTEIEERLREKLMKLLPATFAGEETGTTPGSEKGWVWLVDPQDGTSEFLSGRRGSAISVALLRGGDPVLGVVHAPLSPDRGRDTIAWAEGASAMLRNGEPIKPSLAARSLAAGEFVLATASSAQRPQTWSAAVAPARFVALPSIAYRMARVAAGDAVATVSTHAVSEYDVAAGIALIRAAGGITLDASGRGVVLAGKADNRVSGVFAGAPEAAARLAHFDFARLDGEPRRPPRVPLGFPRPRLPALPRAQGSLLGQVIGDSLGSLVEFKGAAEIARLLSGRLARPRRPRRVPHHRRPADRRQRDGARAGALPGRQPRLQRRQDARRLPRVDDDAAARHRRHHRARPARHAHQRERVERRPDAGFADRDLPRLQTRKAPPWTRAPMPRSRTATRSASSPRPAMRPRSRRASAAAAARR